MIIAPTSLLYISLIVTATSNSNNVPTYVLILCPVIICAPSAYTLGLYYCEIRIAEFLKSSMKKEEKARTLCQQGNILYINESYTDAEVV